MNQSIVIELWMIHDLHLRGAALLVFALWYAERKERSVSELAQMFGYSEFGIRKVLAEVSEAQQSCAEKQQSCAEKQQSCVEKQQSCEMTKERRKENKNNIYYNSTASTDAHARAFEWLTEDEDWLRLLCKNNGLAEQTPRQTLLPYMERFVWRLEESGQDIMNKGAADTKKHFACWLPKYLQIQNSNNEYHRQNKQQSHTRDLLDTASALAAGFAAARTGSGLL